MLGGSLNRVGDRPMAELVGGEHDDTLGQLVDGARGLPFGGIIVAQTEAALADFRRLREELEALERKYGPLREVWRQLDLWWSTDAREHDVRRAVEELETAVLHVIVPEGHGDCRTARCTHCNEDFGWFCPDSPDNRCHYFTDDAGQVTLVNGQKEWPAPHDRRYETEDRCLFCGNPQERK